MKISVILPSLNPNDQMIGVVRGLIDEGFTDIIIVNDGSNEEHMEPFRCVAEYPEVTLLTHEVNRGKGRGLKTAFAYCRDNRPDIDGVVTVDGDGQHTPKDIMACCLAMADHPGEVILGCRDFTRKDIPWKSSVGNNITKVVFRLMCGIRLSDTQTGLRVIPRELLPFMIGIEGERFEYETHMLLEMKRTGIRFTEVPIDTVYLEDNSETHFHPVKDSFKIYRVILRFTGKKLLTFLKFSLGSVTSFLVDIGIFYLTEYLVGSVWGLDTQLTLPAALTASAFGAVLGNILGEQAHMISTITSRVISSIYNYCFNRNLVFRDRSRHTVLKYYALALGQMLLSGLLVTLFTYLFHTDTGKPWQATLVKTAVDCALFFASYNIQRKWVFAGQHKGEKE